jgi:hypothetical protein
MEDVKKCSNCKEIKNLIKDFHALKSSKDGRQHVCKLCQKELRRSRNLKSNPKARIYRNWSKLEVIEEIQQLSKNGQSLKSGYIQEFNCSLYNACKRLFGGWKQAVESALDINYNEEISCIKRNYWDEEKIKEKLEEAIEKLEVVNTITLSDSYNDLYYAILKKYKSLANAIDSLGIHFDNHSVKLHNYWDKEKILQEISSLIESGVDLSSGYVQTNHRKLYRACLKIYGSWGETLYELGIDYKKVMKITRWNKDKIISTIQELFNSETNLTYSKISLLRNDLYLASTRHFGSLESAINEAGVSHLISSEDSYTTADCGRKFENLLTKILLELGINFERNVRVDDCRPDYVLKNDVWIDAKLSQWTTFSSETITKYEPKCKFLTIIFMRGINDVDEMITSKTRLISVRKIIKQLPKHRHNYYLSQVNLIELETRKIESFNTQKISGF